MARRLILRPKAALDVESAVRWYETERLGLGAEFFAEVERVLVSVCEAPLRYPIVYGSTRRALVDRFPYGVFFRESAGQVDVVAVFHSSRDPGSWHVRESAPACISASIAA